MRLDQYLLIHVADEAAGISRAHIQRYIKAKGVLVNGKKTKKPHTPVKDSDTIIFDKASMIGNYSAQPLEKAESEASIIQSSWIIHNEPDFFVINKPAFITSELCVGDFYSVHRLDKGTSGLLVIARTPEAQNKLQQQWKLRKVSKVYEAITQGHISPIKGAIEGPLFRSPIDRRRMVVSPHPRARAARTEYEVLKTFELDAMGGGKLPVTYVRFMPLTGRTHQIRVHSATLGFPIIGDPIYGREDINERVGATHQLLHARMLTIAHPHTKKELVFEAPLPADFQAFLV